MKSTYDNFVGNFRRDQSEYDAVKDNVASEYVRMRFPENDDWRDDECRQRQYRVNNTGILKWM